MYWKKYNTCLWYEGYFSLSIGKLLFFWYDVNFYSKHKKLKFVLRPYKTTKEVLMLCVLLQTHFQTSGYKKNEFIDSYFRFIASSCHDFFIIFQQKKIHTQQIRDIVYGIVASQIIYSQYQTLKKVWRWGCSSSCSSFIIPYNMNLDGDVFFFFILILHRVHKFFDI